MITNEVKKQVKNIWLDLRQTGIKPAAALLEQITWLLYARLIDTREMRIDEPGTELSRNHRRFGEKEQHLRWHKLLELDDEELMSVMQDEVFPHFGRPRVNNLNPPRYLKGAKLLIEDPALLASLVKKIDQLPLTEQGTGGEWYEHLLDISGVNGNRGQYRTPESLVRLMVELLQPKPSDVIGDPACGTGSFFIEAMKYRQAHKPANMPDPISDDSLGAMRGFDASATMLRIATVNLMLHGIDDHDIYYQNTLEASFRQTFPDMDRGAFDLVFCNPPFGFPVSEEKVNFELTHQVRSTRTELLFPVLSLQMLKEKGQAAITIPTQALAVPTGEARQFRELLLKRYRLDAVIELPHKVMYPFMNIPVTVLVVTNDGPTESVFFYRMKTDESSGEQQPEEKRKVEITMGLPDCIARWQARDPAKDTDRKDKAFIVPIGEIMEAGCDLTMNQYKEIIYEAEEYDPPEKLLNHLKTLNQDIDSNLKALEGMLA